MRSMINALRSGLPSTRPLRAAPIEDFPWLVSIRAPRPAEAAARSRAMLEECPHGHEPKKEVVIMKYAQQQAHGSLEATGVGSVEVAPDLADVRLSVITEAATATLAASTNAERLRDVLDAVEALPHRRVSTLGLSLQPIYRYDSETRTSSITGYRAENSIKVEAAVDDAGRIFDAGIAAGANTSSGIDFRLEDDQPYREEAIDRAFRQAHADASAVATAAAVTLLGPEELAVDPQESRPRPLFELASRDVSTPVLPGLLTVSATVRVRFGVQA
jgi:uncharacterized protein YggE